MSKLFIITYFKNKFDLINLFINYYTQLWKVKNITLMMGYTESRNVRKIIKKIKEIKGIKDNLDEIKICHISQNIKNIKSYSFNNLEKNYSITLITYQANKFISRKIFDKIIKTELCKIANSHACKSFENVIVVDNDEFYYSNDIEKTCKNKSQIFHFIEFVPQDVFSYRNDFEFCLKPWFYIEKFVNYNTCKLCKKLYFDRNILNKPDFNIKMVHCHNDSKNMGIVCQKYKNSKNVKKLLFNNKFCFHLSILDKKYLIDNKIKQGFNDTILPEINNKFNEIFNCKNLEIIKINYLKKFLNNKHE